jgi:spore germination protein YaaH
VSLSDTLAGLAIRYHTTTETIRLVNRLKTNNVIERKIIYIPKSSNFQAPVHQIPQPASNQKIISQFISETGTTLEEAKFYLEDASYDYEQALAAWKDDMSWQSSALQNPTACPALNVAHTKNQSTRGGFRFC